MEIKDEVQLKMFYYFMMADGRITANEMALFKTICENLEIPSDVRGRVMRECEEAVDPDMPRLAKVLEQRIMQLLGDEKEREDKTISKSRLHRRILWNLINLGHADKQYSIVERQIVEALGERLKVRKEDVIDMEDTADAMLSLERKRAWIQSVPKSTREKDTVLRRIETDWKLLEEGLKITMGNVD